MYTTTYLYVKFSRIIFRENRAAINNYTLKSLDAPCQVISRPGHRSDNKFGTAETKRNTTPERLHDRRLKYRIIDPISYPRTPINYISRRIIIII